MTSRRIALVSGLLSASLVTPLAAQGLGDTAAREREKRAAQAKAKQDAAKVFTNEDLDKGRPPGAKPEIVSMLSSRWLISVDSGGLGLDSLADSSANRGVSAISVGLGLGLVGSRGCSSAVPASSEVLRVSSKDITLPPPRTPRRSLARDAPILPSSQKRSQRARRFLILDFRFWIAGSSPEGFCPGQP